MEAEARRTKRTHKKMDPAFKSLKQCVLALEQCPGWMVRPTLAFLMDRYVYHPSDKTVRRLHGS